VQELQKARSDYALPAALQRLYRYPLLLIVDVGYVRRDEHESAVLFELICHRYERRSILITSNQPFSAWEEIFPSSSMTVAAVDRLVHHCRAGNRWRGRLHLQEYLSFLRQIEKSVPADLDLHLIVDNYATHKHPKVRAWLSQHSRFHVHYTPTYASWL
jgi:hypothetical protein